MSIGDNQLEVVSLSKLLGVMISSDLKWNEHTLYIVKKAKKRLWFLRRLSKLGASKETLLEMFHLKIRSLLEMACPLFTGSLSKGNIEDFEDVQRQAFKIVLRGNFRNYENALNVLEQETLEERRETLSLKFAKQSIRHPKMKHLFKRKRQHCDLSNCRIIRPPFIEPMVKTVRAEKEPINYLTQLLNKNNI